MERHVASDRHVDFSDKWIKAQIKHPPARRVEWSDLGEKGLKLRIFPTGTASFGVKPRIDGAQRWQQIGNYPTRSLADARRRAKKIMSTALDGIDLTRKEREERETRRREEAERIAREKSSRTVRQLVDEYEAHIKRRRRQWRTTALVLRNHVVARLGNRPLDSLTKADAIELLDHLEHERGFTAQVDHVRTHFASAIDWAIECGYASENVMRQVKSRKLGRERDRLLTPAELRKIWWAADQVPEPGRAFVKLLLLTGMRRDEVRLATWAEIDLEEKVWRVPASRHKSARGLELPLTPAVVELLEALGPQVDGLVIRGNGSDKVWRGHSRLKRALDRESGVTGWVLHDFRRVIRSGLAELGVPFDVSERVLGHSLGKIERIYNRHRYRNETRDALERWQERVHAIVAPRAGNVRELRR